MRVLWHEVLDCTGGETAQEGDMILLPSEMNKNKECVWRMDLLVYIENIYEDGCEDKIDKSSGYQ